MSDRDPGTPGWDAINAALNRIYPALEPFHVAPVPFAALGGKDPLDGISAYRSDHQRPHWHFVSYGMSELYEKTNENKKLSGWGFEFTFRLARQNDEEKPPGWPFNFLQNLARYVWRTGNVFAPGHHMNLNGPIALETQTEIRAVLFAADPELPPIDTPNGRLQFVQIVGVTLD